MSLRRMFSRRKMLFGGQTVYYLILVTALVLTYFSLCWIFTYLDPQLTPETWRLYTPYKNSEQLVANLKASLYILNETEDFSLVKNAEDLKIRNEGYSRYGFNALASRNIGFHRDIPDTRHKLCDAIPYKSELPTTSVVMCFYNEHFDTLIRSLYSIVRNTPAKLLHEIILVDDYSDIERLHEDVQKYVSMSDPLKRVVRLFKTEKREGLIRARIFGANMAEGEVLVFLDSHIEVNRKWLEPMLDRISQNSSAHVVTPIIDIINPDTMVYSASPLVRGGFNWGLHFKWESIPKGHLKSDEDFVKPIKSPTMAGGLFAIDRKYFNDLGQYDPGMDIWGGENLELSFRVWMCGGSLEIIPCSRVGHIFRRQRPYSDGGDSAVRNSLRVAHVWLDQYKAHYFAINPESESVNYGDISDRQKLKARLRCHSFDWYLQHVYPELILPTDEGERLKKKSDMFERPVFQRWDERQRNYVNRFQIRLANTNLCVASEKDVKSKGSYLVLKQCLRKKSQVWYETDKNEFVLARLLCLDSGAASDKPKISKCHEMNGSQEWRHSNTKNTAIYNVAAGTCLGAASSEPNAYVNMQLCTRTGNTRWNLITDTL